MARFHPESQVWLAVLHSRDLLELDITPAVTGLPEGSGTRELLVAHGVPLARISWPPPLDAGEWV